MTPPAQYCLLAMDLDGTLLDGEQKVSARSRAAVHRVAASGAIVALCSGRSTASMIEPQRQLGLDVHIGTATAFNVSSAITNSRMQCRTMAPLDLACRSSRMKIMCSSTNFPPSMSPPSSTMPKKTKGACSFTMRVSCMPSVKLLSIMSSLACIKE